MGSTFPPWRALVRPQELNIEEEVGGPRLPRENLETVLGRRLPQREEAADMDDVSMSCCICYAYRLLAEDGQSGPLASQHTALNSLGSVLVLLLTLNSA